MSIIHVTQIKAKLKSLYEDKIDMTDYNGKLGEERESAFLSRALAVFVIQSHIDTDLANEELTDSVTDGFKDNGIDAIFFHEFDKTLYLVQSKWSHNGTGSIERGETQKFIQGIKDLVNAKFDRFNNKVEKQKNRILKALTDATTKMVLLLAYTGQATLGEDIKRDFEDLLEEINDPSAVMELIVLSQSQLHSIIASGKSGAPINFEVVLREWGQIKEPFLAYYGHISARDVATWWNHHPRLFAPNIRSFLTASDINQDIIQTLSKEPDAFWYFNNGITALCSTIKKKLLGGSSQDFGVFECTDVSIVNGAQTVGAIAAANAKDSANVEKALVMVRFISLENCPNDFAVRVTRATNTQNRIENRDFVSLDPQQDRLRTELQLEEIEYVYKAGYSVSNPSHGFDLTEATVALACVHPELSHAMQAKKGIGALWEDVSKAPYKALFNPGVSGLKLWRLVQIHRIIDIELKIQQSKYQGREAMLPVHGNRFLARQVFKHLNIQDLDDPRKNIDEVIDKIPITTSKAIELAIKVINDKYPESYLANLFKNNKKCSYVEDTIEELWTGLKTREPLFCFK